MRKSGNSFTDDLHRQALRALIKNAILRLENVVVALLAGGAYFLTPRPFPFWQPWFWLVGGAVAEVVMFVVTITDPAEGERAVARLFREEFNPKRIHLSQSRELVRKALEYRDRIAGLVRKQKDSVLKTHLQQASDEINNWVEDLYRLARRLDAYHRNDLIKRDREQVNQDLVRLRERLAAERRRLKQDQVQLGQEKIKEEGRDESLIRELERTIRDREQVIEEWERSLAAKEAHDRNLDRLESTMQRAAIQMGNTLTSMGTVYAQIQLLEAKDIDSGQAQRLREDISEQVNQLEDTISAMDEVYSYHRS